MGHKALRVSSGPLKPVSAILARFAEITVFMKILALIFTECILWFRPSQIVNLKELMSKDSTLFSCVFKGQRAIVRVSAKAIEIFAERSHSSNLTPLVIIPSCAVFAITERGSEWLDRRTAQKSLCKSKSSDAITHRSVLLHACCMCSSSKQRVYKKFALSEISYCESTTKQRRISAAEYFVELVSNSFEQKLFEKPLLVIVNPVGGRKQGLELWESVSPLFISRGVSYHVVVSAYQSHASDIMRGIELTQYSGVITVGGDGLLSEVFNSAMHRNDWECVRKLIFGLIPAGTCNGLAYSTKQCSAFVAAFNILKKNTKKVDSFICVLPERQIYQFGIMTLQWGFFAEVDIKSEMFRFLGEAREYVYAIMKMLFLPKYHCKLSYLEPNQSVHSPSQCGVRCPQCRKNEKSINESECDKRILLCKKAQENSLYCDDEKPLQSEIKWFPKHFRPLFPQIEETDWKTFEDDVCLFSTVLLDNVSPSIKFGSNLHTNDGLMQINCTHAKKVGRLKFAEILATADRGIDSHPETTIIKTHSFILRPEGMGDRSPTLLTVDGEVIPYGEVQLHTAQAFVNIFVE